MRIHKKGDFISVGVKCPECGETELEILEEPVAKNSANYWYEEALCKCLICYCSCTLTLQDEEITDTDGA